MQSKHEPIWKVLLLDKPCRIYLPMKEKQENDLSQKE